MTRRERVRRSVYRISSTHEDGCDCRTCRAAAGDEQAMQELMKELV